MPNLDLKYITDENGNRVLPITHVNAVRDSSGNTLPSLMTPEKNGSGIGTCSTSSGTALTVSLTGYELVQNGFIAVTFANDVPAGATLNINGKGAKPIIYKGSAIEADVIKADDTVTFGYDGTNYVVTSLGGGGSSSVFPEFVTIQLTQSGGSDSALIGATVVVTNDDTSAVILSTTWDGSDISVRIDDGVDYTVTVGNVTDYAIRQNTQSYTAVGGLSKNVTFNYIGYVVDLGLPSGTLWARGNIIPDANSGYKIGEETDYGVFVSWGNIQPHYYNGSAFTDGYNWGSSNTGSPYASTPGAAITSSSYPNANAVYSPNSGYDAARTFLGGSWRMPTATECKELNDNCTSTWVTKNGVSGREFTSNINGAKIFVPGTGVGYTTETYGSSAIVPTSSLYDANNCYYLEGTSGTVYPQRAGAGRYAGMQVRAVQ